VVREINNMCLICILFMCLKGVSDMLICMSRCDIHHNHYSQRVLVSYNIWILYYIIDLCV